MALTTKDTVGIVLVLGTFTAVLAHNNTDHRQTHRPSVADARGAATSAETTETFAFVDFNVVPLDEALEPGRILPNHVVVVQDGIVTATGPTGLIDVPPDAQIISGDGTGYLVPGFVDAHVHLEDAREDILPLFLANGVTTVFNLEGDERHLALRDRVRLPDYEGPAIFTAGPFLDESNVRTPADARRMVAAQQAAGYDFLKVHGEFSEDVYSVLLETARSVDIAVVGHAPRNLSFDAILEYGQAGITHAEELIYTEFSSLDPTGLDAVARRVAEAGTWLTPTLSVFGSISDQWASPEGLAARLARPETRYLPTALRRSWETSDVYTGRPARERGRIEAMRDFHEPLIRSMYEAGVPLLTGTDTPLPGMVPGFSLHDEFDALVAAGLPPEDVLAAATLSAGTFLRQRVNDGINLGTLTPGARADIVLVDSNPFEGLDALRRPRGVMARGRWYDRSALDALLASAVGTSLTADGAK